MQTETAPTQHTTESPEARQARYTQAAQDRAATERLCCYRLADGTYLVRSRHACPGAYRIVSVWRDRVSSCGCPAWQYRGACAHAGAVLRRLAREARRTAPATTPTSLRPATRSVAPLTAAEQRVYDALFG